MELTKEMAIETEPERGREGERGMELVGQRGKEMEEGTCL